MSLKKHMLRYKQEYFFWGVLVLVFSCAAWFMFHNLAKFETSDEEYWKEGRIAGYWGGWEDGLEEGDWSGTYINDKPGVTLALVAGIGLPVAGDLLDRYQGIYRVHGEWILRSYDISLSETINTALRLPVATFSLGMMFLIVFLIWLYFRSAFPILIFTSLFALHPFLLGMSHILNPDTLFWTTGFTSILLFMLLLQTGLWRYAILTGSFFGLAVAAKYTANLLLLIYLLVWIYTLIFSDTCIHEKVKVQIYQFFLIAVFGYAIFAFLMPASIQNPELFLKGTVYAPGMNMIIVPLCAFLLVSIVDAYFFKNVLFVYSINFFRSIRLYILRFLAGAMLLLMTLHIANAWMGTPWVPLNDLKEITRGELGGSKYEGLLTYPYAFGDTSVVIWGKKILAQSADMIFTLPSLVFFVLFVGCAWVSVTGRIRSSVPIALGLTVPWIFSLGGIFANVFVNARYAIIVQPLLILTATVFVAEGLSILQRRWEIVRKHTLRIQLGGVTVLIVASFCSVGSVSSHLANYQNIFLPKEFSLADSWSYGIYEAAEYLNQKPLAEHLEVWSDRDVLCRFFVGKCLKSGSFDRSLVDPDYIVITRRNVVKGNHFTWQYPEEKTIPSEAYYEGARFEDPEWEIDIGGRSENYIKIIAVDKERLSDQEVELWTNYE